MVARTSLLIGLSCLAAVGLTGDLQKGAIRPMTFAQPLAHIQGEALIRFTVGTALFRVPWHAQSGARGRMDGLGPLFNASSCVGCHIANGRGYVPVNEADTLRTTVVRLSVTGRDGVPAPEPTYGDQLQSTGIARVPGEGNVSLRWHEVEQALADGTRIALRRPELTFSDLQYGPLSYEAQTSTRMAPSLLGLGLLAAVPEQELIALTDPDDRDQDGVRGRLNRVWSVETGRMEIGRFGLKANQPTLRQQVASALIADMGVTSRLYMGQNCTPIEETCLNSPVGRRPEISDDDLELLVAYVAALAPPARREFDKVSEQGEVLFHQIGCAACHTPSLPTASVRDSNRPIHPYTDLLLHDMGEGLADERPDHEASGRDWRTAPLWGIGLAGTAIRKPTYLHDGRARDFVEAILWHGGEGARARDAFAVLREADRNAIVAFLNRL